MLHSELTGRALKCAITVRRALGPGYPESMYQAALELELRAEGLKVARECPIVVLYRGSEIGEFRADLILEGRIVLELKALSELGKGEHRQLLNTEERRYTESAEAAAMRPSCARAGILLLA